jgi:glycerol uptake facilitator-like aquaporin
MGDLPRRLAAEALGTALLVAAIVGSGMMATSLTAEPALALFCNSASTAAMLVVLISILGPVSGAHLNPAVTMVFACRGEMRATRAILYLAAQVAGALAGTLLAHAMFDIPLGGHALPLRTGPGQWLSEAVATFGLILVVLLARQQAVAWLVGLYISSAYWFTASTSFANPAVTIGRALTASFAGIRTVDVPAFVLAQLAGATAAMLAAQWLRGALQAPSARSPEAAGRPQ